eukprot:359116-Chlamydomonas_euryale.AAC.11
MFAHVNSHAVCCGRSLFRAAHAAVHPSAVAYSIGGPCPTWHACLAPQNCRPHAVCVECVHGIPVRVASHAENVKCVLRASPLAQDGIACAKCCPLSLHTRTCTTPRWPPSTAACSGRVPRTASHAQSTTAGLLPTRAALATSDCRRPASPAAAAAATSAAATPSSSGSPAAAPCGRCRSGSGCCGGCCSGCCAAACAPSSRAAIRPFSPRSCAE